MSTKIRTFLLFLAGACQASNVVPLNKIAVPPPVVTAASSQYFERIFNRLFVAPPVLEAPVLPFSPTPAVFTVNPDTRTSTVHQPSVQTDRENVPNVAFAVATAQAAPVATILLPPYPFAQPQTVGFIPSVNVIPTDPPKRETEPTTERVQPTTTQTDPESSAALPSNINTFLQGLPISQNVEFQKYGAPSPAPTPTWPAPRPKPQKLKTSVEVVPVPLAYITPPPLKPIKQSGFIPKAKIIIRPVKYEYIKVRVPARIIYKVPSSRLKYARARNFQVNQSQKPIGREAEPTTFSPISGPHSKPPRLL